MLVGGAACFIVTEQLRLSFALKRQQRLVIPQARGLTFAERVAYQRVIEDVYWRHRIWPKSRPDPKPSLDAVMSRASWKRRWKIICGSHRALEDYWQRPITAEELQAEMDPMAKHTRQPESPTRAFSQRRQRSRYHRGAPSPGPFSPSEEHLVQPDRELSSVPETALHRAAWPKQQHSGKCRRHMEKSSISCHETESRSAQPLSEQRWNRHAMTRSHPTSVTEDAALANRDRIHTASCDRTRDDYLGRLAQLSEHRWPDTSRSDG